MCIGLCKGPTEAFFNHELGLPVSLLPNFEDGSCTMTWGEPATANDLADQDLSCYADCSMDGHAALSVAVRAHCAETPPAPRPPLIGPLLMRSQVARQVEGLESEIERRMQSSAGR
jgi:hypothetical protein